jgi:hypothetical protein
MVIRLVPAVKWNTGKVIADEQSESQFSRNNPTAQEDVIVIEDY